MVVTLVVVLKTVIMGTNSMVAKSYAFSIRVNRRQTV